MAFNYDVDNVSFTGTATEKRNAVRLLLRDTVDAGHLLEDEEIDEIIAVSNNIWNAAATLVDVVQQGIASGGVDSVKYTYLKDQQPIWRKRGNIHSGTVLVQRTTTSAYNDYERTDADGVY